MYTLCYCYIPYVTSTGPYPTGTSSISQHWTPPYRYKPYITNTGPRHSRVHLLYHELVPVLSVLPTGPSPPDISPISHVLVPVLPVYPQYNKHWTLFYRYIPNTTVLDPVLQVHPLYIKHWSLSYQYIPFITVIAMFYPFIPYITVLALFYRYIPYITVLALFYRCITVISSTCPVLPVHPLYQKYWTCATGTPSMSQVLDPAIPVHPLYHKYWSLSYWYIPCPLYARTCDEIFYNQLDNIFGFKRHTPALQNVIFSFYFMS